MTGKPRYPTVTLFLTEEEADAVEWALKVSILTATPVNVLGKRTKPGESPVDPELALAMLPRIRAVQGLMIDAMAAAGSRPTTSTGSPPRARSEAANFLVRMLSSAGPLPWSTIAEFGRGAGHTEITLRRVRDEVARQVRHDGRTMWALDLA